MRLACAMIRVLPQNHDAHRIERGQFERAEAVFGGRIDDNPRHRLGSEEPVERLHISAVERWPQRAAPARMQRRHLLHAARLSACGRIRRGARDP